MTACSSSRVFHNTQIRLLLCLTLCTGIIWLFCCLRERGSSWEDLHDAMSCEPRSDILRGLARFRAPKGIRNSSFQVCGCRERSKRVDASREPRSASQDEMLTMVIPERTVVECNAPRHAASSLYTEPPSHSYFSCGNVTDRHFKG